MSAFLDERYFEWLYRQVSSVEARNPRRTYRNLLHIMYTKEMVWLVPNDDNRLEDGKDLRPVFFEDEWIPKRCRDSHWLSLECSFLEFMVALSMRLEFETDVSVKEWFWHLIDNLGLTRFNDRANFDRDDVEVILDRVIWRTYAYNGAGGLFPLVYPERDQTQIEIWYQLSAYVLENGYI